MKFRSSFFALAIIAWVVSAAPVAANQLTFQGVTFETLAVDSDTLQLSIFNATSATGNWIGIGFLKAFEIKDIPSTSVVTSATIISGPGAFGSDVNHGLSAAALGCTTGGTNGACFSGAPILLTDSMTWTIDFTGTILNFGAPHLKVQFLTGVDDTEKTGSLFSSPIPEPETYAMMLAGLGLMGFIARRRRMRYTAA